MGNKLSSVFLSDHFISSSSISTLVDLYFPNLGTLHYQKSLGRGRLMKTILMKDNHGNAYIIKILLRPEGFSIDQELAQFTAMNTLLCSLSSHILSQYVLTSPSTGPSLPHPPHTSSSSSSSSASSSTFSGATSASSSELVYTVRSYIYTNLYDRLSSRPFLSRIERLWIAYQLLWTLESAHTHDIFHGDVKSENVLLTTWNFLYLSDWTCVYKPTSLRMDHPSDYLYFFASNSDGRRACTIAPERFVLAETEDAKVSTSEPCRTLTAAMDIFSAGCVLAEIFLDNLFTNQGLFDFQSLLAYQTTSVPPHHEHLDKIGDVAIRSMISDMTALDPGARPSLSCLLNDVQLFPSYFNPLLQLMNQLSKVDLDATARIQQLSAMYSKLEALLPTNTGGEDWVLIISFICSHVRSLHSPTAISLAIQLLLDISKKTSAFPKIALDRILPYVAIFLKSGADIGGGHHFTPPSSSAPPVTYPGTGPGATDDSSEIRIRMLAMSCVLELLETLSGHMLPDQGLPKSDECLFIDYLLPLYAQHCLSSTHPLIRSALSSLLPRLYGLITHLSLNPTSRASEWKEIRDWVLVLLKDADENVISSCMMALNEFPLSFWKTRPAENSDHHESGTDDEMDHWQEELLSHLISTLNHRTNQTLGLLFYALAPKISLLLGSQRSLVGLKEYLLPLLLSALNAKKKVTDERCIYTVLESLNRILEAIVTMTKSFEFVEIAKSMMEVTLVYTCHPSPFIRGRARQLFERVKEACHLKPIDSYASLSPMLSEYRARLVEPCISTARPRPPLDAFEPNVKLGLPRSYLLKRDKLHSFDVVKEKDKTSDLEQLMQIIQSKQRARTFLASSRLQSPLPYKSRSILPDGNSLKGRVYLTFNFPCSEFASTVTITNLCLLEGDRESFLVAGSSHGKLCVWKWSDLISYQSTRPIFSTSLPLGHKGDMGVCQLTQLGVFSNDEPGTQNVACIYADSVYLFSWRVTGMPQLHLEHQFKIEGTPVLLCFDHLNATLYVVSQEGRLHVYGLLQGWRVAPVPFSVDLSLNALPTTAKLILQGTCLVIGCASGKVRLVDTRFLVSLPLHGMEWTVPKLKQVTAIYSLKWTAPRVETMDLREALRDEMTRSVTSDGREGKWMSEEQGEAGPDKEDENEEDCLLIAGLGGFPLTLWQRRRRRPRSRRHSGQQTGSSDQESALEGYQEEAGWHCLCVWMTRDEHESNDLSHFRTDPQASQTVPHFEHRLPIFTSSTDYIEKELSGIQYLCLLDNKQLIELRTNGRLRDWRLDAPTQSSLILSEPRAQSGSCGRKLIQVVQPSVDLYCILENDHREDEQTHHGLFLPSVTNQLELRNVSAMLACKMNINGDWVLVLGDSSGNISIMI